MEDWQVPGEMVAGRVAERSLGDLQRRPFGCARDQQAVLRLCSGQAALYTRRGGIAMPAAPSHPVSVASVPSQTPDHELPIYARTMSQEFQGIMPVRKDSQPLLDEWTGEKTFGDAQKQLHSSGNGKVLSPDLTDWHRRTNHQRYAECGGLPRHRARGWSSRTAHRA
jgi:hypothetical protein